MPINLSRVNVSLQQFQEISSGKYNAGEAPRAISKTAQRLPHFPLETGGGMGDWLF